MILISRILTFCYASDYEKDIYKRDFNVVENSLLLSGLPEMMNYTLSSEQVKHYREVVIQKAKSDFVCPDMEIQRLW